MTAKEERPRSFPIGFRPYSPQSLIILDDTFTVMGKNDGLELFCFRFMTYSP